MRTTGFSKTYGERRALDIPPVEFTPGRVCAVVGANGSGKSTLARILAGTLKADGGKKPFEDGLAVGYMPQKSYAFRMSVTANIGLTGRDAARAKELMEGLDISHLAKSRGDRLSGGETARMALARLLMASYDLLILDEPTAAMDIRSTALAERLIAGYCAQTGCALVLVTHSLRQARALAQEALFLHNGVLWESGPAQKVLFEPEREETARFLEFYGA